VIDKKIYQAYKRTPTEHRERLAETEALFDKLFPGLDVTPEVFADDAYFFPRFGCGQLRYLCHK